MKNVWKSLTSIPHLIHVCFYTVILKTVQNFQHYCMLCLKCIPCISKALKDIKYNN